MTFKGTIYDLFLRKIELDKDFFNYYKLAEPEAIELISKRCVNYYGEAITRFLYLTESPMDMFKEVKYVDTAKGIDEMVIDTDLSVMEIDLIASLMREIHYERDVAKLKAMMLKFTPKDLNVFSPANERKSFMDMFEYVQKENRKMIDVYNSRDRETGKRKQLIDG